MFPRKCGPPHGADRGRGPVRSGLFDGICRRPRRAAGPRGTLWWVAAWFAALAHDLMVTAFPGAAQVLKDLFGPIVLFCAGLRGAAGPCPPDSSGKRPWRGPAGQCTFLHKRHPAQCEAAAPHGHVHPAALRAGCLGGRVQPHGVSALCAGGAGQRPDRGLCGQRDGL